MRKLASIQKILAVDPIVGADAIVRVKVLGWECVAKKEEFNVGDLCAYFEIDSLLPVAPWTDFLRKGDERPFRLKTVTLRGQLSQGLALPISKLPTLPEGTNLVEGEDVTEVLGVEKWEAQVPAQLAGQVKGNFPSFLKKTDEPRIQAEPAIVDEVKSLGLRMKGRQKIDGTSFSAYVEFHYGAEKPDEITEGVCSRNLDLRETADNAYWKMARKVDIFGVLCEHAELVEVTSETQVHNIAVQAELAGPGIQGNKMGYKELKLVLFNLVINGRYANDTELVEFADLYGFELAPVVYDGVFPVDITAADLLKLAYDLNYENGTPAEGIVWRPVNEVHSSVLKGRLSFKTISNRFLTKYKE